MKREILLLADTSDSLQEVEEEADCKVGQLLTPLSGFRNRAVEEGRPWALDNGAFAGFERKKWLRRLKGQKDNRDSCLFVAAPDVVGSARRTLEVFDHWGNWLLDKKWPVALVAQDGLEDMDIPWDSFSCLFIGGSTEWKLGDHAEACIRAAQALDKWVHVGRINTSVRLDKFAALGVNSFDGTGLSRFSHMRRNLAAGLPLLGEQSESGISHKSS